MAKVGRPKKAPEARKARVLAVPLTPAEKRRLDRIAAERGDGAGTAPFWRRQLLSLADAMEENPSQASFVFVPNGEDADPAEGIKITTQSGDDKKS